MTIGTYKTTDPNVRIRVVFDEEYPTENPAFLYAEGVLEELQKCHFEGDYYGVIVETRSHKTPYQIAWGVLGDNAIQPNDRRGGNAIASLIEQAIHLDRLQRGEEWEDHDSIWSCAGYGDKVAETVAKEHFGITVTGKM